MKITSWFLIPFMLFHLPATVTATVRRLHDINRSGWWVLLAVFHIKIKTGIISLSIGLMILCIMLCFEGSLSSNKFGKVPEI